MKLMLRSLAIITLTALLAGCGFHLQGQRNYPAPLKHLYIESNNPYGGLVSDLNRVLDSSGMNLVEHKKQAQVILNITSESMGQSTESVSSTALIRSYTLTLSVAYQLEDANGKALMPVQRVGISRYYTASANQMLGDANEANTLKQEMQRSAAYQILQQLSSQETQEAVEKMKAQNKKNTYDVRRAQTAPTKIAPSTPAVTTHSIKSQRKQIGQ